MIGSLRGTPTLTTDKYALIDVGGVGYKVYMTPQILASIGNEDIVTVFTYTVVREDALDLYGFLTLHEETVFELLLGVSGIGPRSALGILAIASTDTLTSAIARGDTAYLTQVSGIGRKTAEKIVLELRDKVLTGNFTTETHSSHERDTMDALVSLGYREHDIRDTLRSIDSSVTDTQTRIKEALKILGQKK